MSTINSLISALRIYIIPSATILRSIYCLIKIMYEQEEKKVYIRRLINIIAFLIISELVFVIKDIIEYYYYLY